MKTELISKMEELLLKDTGEAASDVRTLQKEYQKIWTKEFESAKQTFIDEGGKLRDFDYPKQKEDLDFEKLTEKFNQLKKQNDAKIAGEQSKNLLIRQEIIAKIKDISKLSENVGSAIRMMQELQNQWKEAGQVSSHKYKEIQAEYSKAIEEIYYTINIFRDLQEHDLKKNLENKTILIEKVKGLQSIESIKEAERLIKIYRNEWEEIGPVQNSKWEILKQDFKSALDETYSKIKLHYNAIEEKKENNLQAKLQVIQQAHDLIAKVQEMGKATKWNDATEELVALQNEWKGIGRTTEKDNEKIWNEFRQLCDLFFEKKREFFSELNEKFAESRKLKSVLIEKAEALKDSADWVKTSHDIIKLQDEWKKISSHGDREEPRLFQKFRKVCNHFFDAKKQHQESIEKELEGNVKLKEEILEKLKSYEASDDAKANHDFLKATTAEWNQIGHVPFKDKKTINDAFYNLLDALYDKLHIDKKEKAIIQFKTKVERMVSAENNLDLLRKENDFLRKQIEEINGRVRTYDNNLGFFKTSKGSGNTFMKEIEEKIEIEKSKMAELSSKRKLVVQELEKLKPSN